jgi:hypothetical protein
MTEPIYIYIRDGKELATPSINLAAKLTDVGYIYEEIDGERNKITIS